MPQWLDEAYVLQLHHAQIDEHGGSYGVLNSGALDSTLYRPIRKLEYEPESTLFELAASYGFGFARNHCFKDGNKRIALVVTDVFLILNGWELEADELETTDVMLRLAKGELDEAEFAAWVEMKAVAFEVDAR